MRKFVAGLMLISCATPIAAQTMNAEIFYQRATKVKGKGALAIFSMGEVKKLMAEVQAAGKVARERRLADASAGKVPRYCPPAEVKMEGEDFLARLGRIPLSERKRIDMTEASTRIMASKYPCKR